MLGIHLNRRLSFYSSFKSILIGVALGIALVGATSSQPAYAAAVYTEKPIYLPGENAVIAGVTFLASETVTLKVTREDGTLLPGTGSQPWDVPASSAGNFNTQWSVIWAYAGDTLLVTAKGKTSGAMATTTFLAPKSDLNQLQNGTSTSAPEWANGNINTTNSCYAEGRSVAYRFFVDLLDAGSKHYFTIEMEWTKGGVHALDYLTDYDATESAAIAIAGGPCGTISTTPPPGCTTPTVTFAFPDFLNTANYSGTIPSDFFTTVNPGFVLDGPRNLSAYNVTIDSLGKYMFSGSASDRTFSFVVYFTVQNAGSVGFFWGGHLAEGAADAWGIGNGSASVSGAPYHMTASGFDGGGGGGSNRSIQNGNICLPPNVGILCGSGTVCNIGSQTYVCRDTASAANRWLWTVTNGTIIGSNALDSVVYSVNPGLNPGDYVYVTVQSCDSLGGCPGVSCCATDSVAIPVVNCNNPPTVTCANDTTVFLCNLTSVCIPGFVCSDPDNNLVSCQVSLGTLSGNTVCFTPTGAGVYPIRLIGTDSYGLADTCVTNVTVVLNAPPVATCPGNQTKFVCDLSPITITGFSCSDVDNNLTSCTVNNGTLNGNAVTFTPVAGANVITLTATDACGRTSTCQTTITVNLNHAPVATCAGDTSVTFACAPSPISVGMFSATDVDNNITTQTVSLGTLSAGRVTFTPDTAGVYTITYTVTDACGATSQCHTHVTVQYINHAPVAACHGDTTMFVCSLAPITLGGFGCSDVDGNLTSCVATGGTLNGSQVTFTPVAGVNTITLTATDACGLTSSCQTKVTVNLNHAPVAACPGNVTLFRCDLSDITLGGFSCTDVDGNLTSCTVNNGTLDGNEVTFSPNEGDNTITLTATDACGVTSTCQTTVTVILNLMPTVDLPNNDSKFLCATQQLCYPITVGDPDYPQYHGLPTAYLLRGPGAIVNNVLCFTPTAGRDTTYWFVIQVCDSCGYPSNPAPPSPLNSCVVDSFSVTVAFNDPPVAGCPANDTIAFNCGPSQICVGPFTKSDPDNNITGESVSYGTLAGGQVCFTPDTAGVYTILYTVTDACGASDQCETKITVQYANQPPVATCPGDQIKTVCDLSQICLGGFSCTDPNGNLASCTVTGGTLNGNTVCFTPVAGVNTLTLIATDACGLADTCITRVTVNVIPPPVISDTIRTVAMCAPGQTCVGLPQVTGGRPPYGWQYNGQTVTGSVCFNLSDDSVVVGSIKVTDSCGRNDIATFIVHAAVNTAPVVSVNVVSPQFLCQVGAQVCAKLTIVDPDNTLSGTSTIGTVRLSDSTVCFAADTAGHYCNRVIIADSCGLKDTVSYCVDVALNHTPVCHLPGDTTYTQCEPELVCRPVSATDVDGNLTGCAIVTGPGYLMNGNWCYTPAATGSVTVTIKCTDQCGAFCEGSFTTTFNVDRPPVVACHTDTSFVMAALSEICLTGFECSDPDGDLVSCTSNRGPINGGEICFMPEEGLNNVIVDAEDACGRIASCTTRVWVVIVRECPVVRLEKTEGTLQGHTVDLALTIENAGLFQIAGFDFLIAYDASALTFIQAEKGDLLTGCGWEYFTYRFGPDGNCGSGCPSGMLRLIGLAETNNGPSHPSCYGPSDLGVHGLADLRFLVSNDRTLECQYIPVYFYWLNCNDNAVSNIDGDSLIIDSRIFDFEGGVIWDEFDDDIYPNDERRPFTGADDSCLIGFKVTPYRCLEFWNGGVDIVCADSIDARGDINLNGIANEVADAVLFTNYFIDGLSAFPVPEGSIAASDVNADGIALSVADLVYLVRVIVGDAVPYAKPLPDASFTVETRTTDQGLEVSYNASSTVGAALLTFTVDGSCGTPVLGAGARGMSIASGLKGSELRVLVYDIGPGSIAAGHDLLLTVPGDGLTLTDVEAADHNGGAMATSTRAIPTSFELTQNYPNPFNPTTAIKLNLAAASEWTISIFNVAGQKVREYTGRSDAGTVEVIWDAADFGGNRVASGIYLYRATAGSYSATKKMVLMK